MSEPEAGRTSHMLARVNEEGDVLVRHCDSQTYTDY